MKINCCPKCEKTRNREKVALLKENSAIFAETANTISLSIKLAKIDDYYVTKVYNFYLEGLSLREIERILGISCHHQFWIKEYNIKKPPHWIFMLLYRFSNK